MSLDDQIGMVISNVFYPYIHPCGHIYRGVKTKQGFLLQYQNLGTEHLRGRFVIEKGLKFSLRMCGAFQYACLSHPAVFSSYLCVCPLNISLSSQDSIVMDICAHSSLALLQS